jgi:mono/diheme cytochrome c family protein
MRKLLLLPALALGIFILSDCSPKTGKSTTASTTTKTEAHYSDAQVAEGKTIFTDNCGRCHKLINPADKSVDKWNSVLPTMIHKAKLSDEQGELVRAYVMANVRK